MTTVTLEDPPPGVAATFRALNTFLPSGELLVSSSVGLPATRSLAHGDWIRTGNRRFASSFVFFRFDPAGAFIGSQRVHRTILLAASLNAFTSTDVVEILDPSGTVIRSSRATEVGQRPDRSADRAVELDGAGEGRERGRRQATGIEFPAACASSE